jgi:hypothetical protein
MERDIINHYISLHSPKKNAVYNLKTQLLSGTFRFSCENAEPNGLSKEDSLTDLRNHEWLEDVSRPELFAHSSAGSKHNYVLKISGIWETNFNVGITVKFIYA